MARKNEYGRYILSAGEISSYVVCPQAWYLSEVKHVTAVYTEKIRQGKNLHKKWADDFEEALFFTRAIKTILLFVILMLLVVLLTQGQQI